MVRCIFVLSVIWLVTVLKLVFISMLFESNQNTMTARLYESL